MTRRPEIREKLQKAVRLIINTQNNEGGWRYQPVRADADLSVTICQINALRAARNAGIFVPKETVDACIKLRQAVAEPRRRLPLHAPGRRQRLPAIRGGDRRPVQRGGVRRQGDRRRDRLPQAVHARDQVRPALQPLLLRPLLRGPGDVDPRRRRLEHLVSRDPRRAGPPPDAPGLLAGQHLPRVRHGDGPDHPPDAEQRPADLPDGETTQDRSDAPIPAARDRPPSEANAPDDRDSRPPRRRPMAWLGPAFCLLLAGADGPGAVPSDPAFTALKTDGTTVSGRLRRLDHRAASRWPSTTKGRSRRSPPRLARQADARGRHRRPPERRAERRPLPRRRPPRPRA